MGDVAVGSRAEALKCNETVTAMLLDVDLLGNDSTKKLAEVLKNVQTSDQHNKIIMKKKLFFAAREATLACEHQADAATIRENSRAAVSQI